MSTSYYKFNDPISAIKVHETGKHAQIHLWEWGAKVGTITVQVDDKPNWIYMFHEHGTPAACYRTTDLSVL